MYQPFKVVVRLSSVLLLGYMYLLGRVYIHHVFQSFGN